MHDRTTWTLRSARRCLRSARWRWCSARSTCSRRASSSRSSPASWARCRRLAKGARRLKSPFQGGLDLLGVSDIVVLHKASEALDLLTEAAPVERFASLRRDLAALYAGYYIAELLSDLTDFHDPHPKLFDAATITLAASGRPGLARPAGAPVRAGLPARAGADAGARRLRPLRRRRSEAVGARRSRSAWRPAACSARPAGPASRTWRRSRDGRSTRSASWRRPGAAWRDLDPSPAALAPVRTTLGRGHQPPAGPSPPTPALSRESDPMPLAHRSRHRIRPPAAAPAPASRRAARSVVVLALVGAAGSAARAPAADPLSLWRQGPRLVALERAHRGRGSRRQPQPHGPLAHPQEEPALGPRAIDPPTPLILGSDGWKPMKPLEEPRGRQPSSQAAETLFQQGKLDRGRDGLRQARQEPQGDPLGREGPVLPGRVPVPARQATSTAHDSFEQLDRRLPRHRVPRQAGQPRVRHRPALARPGRPQGQARGEAPLVRPLHRRAAPARHPRLRPQGARARPPPRPDRPARRRRRAPDRRRPHGHRRLRVRRPLLRPAHRPTTPRARSSSAPSSPRSTPG